jgi:hypothetical protein
VWKTVKEAYATWWRNFPDLIRVCWIWMLLMAPLWAIWVMWWQEPYIVGRIQAIRAGQSFDPSDLVPNVAPLVGLIMLPAFASMAVPWHRLLLRDEHPRVVAYLRLDCTVAAYAGIALAGNMVMLAPNYVGAAFRFAGDATQDGAAALVASVEHLASVVIMFILARLSLVLPAMALGRRDVTLRAAWTASTGNSLRMSGAYVLCFLPLFVIRNGTLTFLSHNDDHVAATLALITMNLLVFPVSMIGVGMLSLAYRHFFEGDAQAVRLPQSVTQ